MLSDTYLDRRTWLKTTTLAVAASACGAARAQSASLHGALPPWSEGVFDIHHIDTGRGNATLLIFPDGTTLLIDAGDASSPVPGTMAPPRPNSTVTPAEAITKYIHQHAPEPRLDYFLATHIHPDHVSAIEEVVRQIPVGTCIDRGYPHYLEAEQPVSAPWATAYIDFLESRSQARQAVEAAKVGSTTQISLKKKHSSSLPFTVRILAANGNVWNPATKQIDALLTNADHPHKSQWSENIFSIALLFRYGTFSYYTGGDLSSDTHDGRVPELDIETPVATAAGKVDIAVANHHGYFDACGPGFANALDAKVYVVPSWDIGHPGSAQMQRLLGAWEGKPTHDVFALELLPANALLNRRFAAQLKSQQGHVVVRVVPGGASYTIYTLDPTTETSTITGVFGPYRSRA